MKIASSLQCGRCIPTPPPPIFHALVSSTYKPIELDNLDPHTTGTSIYHIDNSNNNSNNNNNYNNQVDCPVFISDDDYYEFCHTMNTLIQQYDTIIHQRQRIQFYFNTCAMVSSGIMMEIFLMKYYQWVNDNEMTIIHFISVLFRGFGYYILVIIIGSIITAALTSSPMKRIKNHQYQLLCKVHQLCHNISFHRLVLVPNPLSVSSSSSSVSTLAPVKVTFQMEWKLDQDFRGRYSIMDAVKITVVKTISTTTNTDITDENDDDDDQGVISSNTATTSTVGAAATTARNRQTTTTLVEGMTITTTVVTTNIVTTNDECYDEDTVFDSDRCITVIDIPNSNDDEDGNDNNNSSSEQQHAPLPKKRMLHSLDATKIDYEFSNYVIL